MRSVVISVAVALSLIPLWPVYQSPYFFVALAAGILLGILLAVLSHRRGWSLFTTVIAAIIGYLVVSVPVAIPSQSLWGLLPTPQGVLSSLGAVVLSWKQLVTIMPPVGSYQALLIPTFLLAYVGTLVGVKATLQWRTGWKSNLAPIVPLLSLGLAIWLGSPIGYAPIAVSAGVFVLIALWFASERAGATPATFRSLGVIAVAVVVAAAVIVVTPQLNRDVWRTAITTPFVLRENTSPLSAYRSYITGDTAQQTLLRVKGLAAGQSLSLATLDSYDGVIYSVGHNTEDFTTVPERLPPEDAAVTAVNTVISIDKLTGPWVPLPGQLGKVNFTPSDLSESFYYSRAASSGALVTGLSSGIIYTASGFAPVWDAVSNLADYKPGNAAVAAPQVVPNGLDAFIATSSRTSSSPGQRLEESLSALLDQGYISHGQPEQPVSASGHGANRITDLFANEPMVGDAEQYAVAAALIATQTGFPARVVMGFIAGESAQADQEISFVGQEMTAWIEISTTQGWIAVNPNPQLRPIPQEQPEDPTEVAFPETAVDPPAEPQAQENTQSQTENVDEEPPATSDPFLAAVLAVATALSWLLLVLGIVSSPLVAIAVVKRRRRSQRRHAPTAGEQVLGAWEEARDKLMDSGMETSISQTRTEIADSSGIQAALLLAVQADTAQYSTEQVSSDTPDQAWGNLAALEKDIATGQSRREKLKTRFSLSSLGLTWTGFKRWFRLGR